MIFPKTEREEPELANFCSVLTQLHFKETSAGAPAKGVSRHLQRSLSKHLQSGICQSLSALPPPPHSLCPLNQKHERH